MNTNNTVVNNQSYVTTNMSNISSNAKSPLVVGGIKTDSFNSTTLTPTEEAPIASNVLNAASLLFEKIAVETENIVKVGTGIQDMDFSMSNISDKLGFEVTSTNIPDVAINANNSNNVVPKYNGDTNKDEMNKYMIDKENEIKAAANAAIAAGVNVNDPNKIPENPNKKEESNNTSNNSSDSQNNSGSYSAFNGYTQPQSQTAPVENTSNNQNKATTNESSNNVSNSNTSNNELLNKEDVPEIIMIEDKEETKKTDLSKNNQTTIINETHNYYNSKPSGSSNISVKENTKVFTPKTNETPQTNIINEAPIINEDIKPIVEPIEEPTTEIDEPKIVEPEPTIEPEPIIEDIVPKVDTNSNSTSAMKTIGIVAGAGLAVGAAALGAYEYTKKEKEKDDYYDNAESDGEY